MRTRAGGGAGHEVRSSFHLLNHITHDCADAKLENDDDDQIDELLRLLEFGTLAIKDQRALGADPRWMKKAQAAARGFAKWSQEIEDFEKRRTMPVTNGNGRRSAMPSSTIGYRYRDAA